jgi:hypothetical protein
MPNILLIFALTIVLILFIALSLYPRSMLQALKDRQHAWVRA